MLPKIICRVIDRDISAQVSRLIIAHEIRVKINQFLELPRMRTFQSVGKRGVGKQTDALKDVYNRRKINVFGRRHALFNNITSLFFVYIVEVGEPLHRESGCPAVFMAFFNISLSTTMSSCSFPTRCRPPKPP